MAISAKNYTMVNINIRNKSVAYSTPQVCNAPKVHCLNFGLIRFLFRYFTDAEYLKLILGI